MSIIPVSHCRQIQNTLNMSQDLAALNPLLSEALQALSPRELMTSPEYKDLSPPHTTELWNSLKPQGGASPQAGITTESIAHQSCSQPANSVSGRMSPEIFQISLTQSFAPPASTPRTRGQKASALTSLNVRKALFSEYICITCKKSCKSKAGLVSHSRVHTRKAKECLVAKIDTPAAYPEADSPASPPWNLAHEFTLIQSTCAIEHTAIKLATAAMPQALAETHFKTLLTQPSEDEVTVVKVVPAPSEDEVIVVKVVPAARKVTHPPRPRKIPGSTIRRRAIHKKKSLKRSTALRGLCPQCPSLFDTRRSLIVHLKDKHPLGEIQRERKSKPSQDQNTQLDNGDEDPTSLVQSIIMEIIEKEVPWVSERIQCCKLMIEELDLNPEMPIPGTPATPVTCGTVDTTEREGYSPGTAGSTPTSPLVLDSQEASSMGMGSPSTPSRNAISMCLGETLNMESPHPSPSSSMEDLEVTPLQTQTEVTHLTLSQVVEPAGQSQAPDSHHSTLPVAFSLPISTTSYLAEQHLLPLKTRGDGLCILRAITTCLQYATQWGYTVEDLSQKLLNEVETSKEKYSPFCLDTPDVVKATKEYLHKKKYMSEISDLLIEALAHALSIKITIISREAPEQTGVMSISPYPQGGKTRAEVYLLRSDTKADAGTHYDSVIPGSILRKKLVLVSQSEGECMLRCPITSQKYLLFQHPSPLSNFAKLNLSVENTPYSSVEQFYQASKFKKGTDTHSSIMNCNNPFRIKQLGKKSPTRSQPENTMVKGLTAKFNEKGSHQEHLLNTSECILIESTHDNYWGIGRDFTRDHNPSQYLNRTNWTGSNKLGVEIMRIRSEVIRTPTITKLGRGRPCKGTPTPTAPKPTPSKVTLSPAWLNPPASIKEKGLKKTPVKPTTSSRQSTLALLPVKGLYIPPQGMQAREVIATVTSLNPTLGRCLAYEKGKITSSHPEALKALKGPLLPGHRSLGKPLSRFLPAESVKSHWLSTPLANTACNATTIASNPRVVHVSAHDKNSTHTIWHITTGQLSQTSSKHIEPNYLEAGTTVLSLVPFTPPIRCTFCQSLEHTKFDCWAEYSSCVFCAGHHSADECGQRWRHKCANCLGPHKASDPACPEVKAKRARQGLPQLSTQKSGGHKHSIPVPTCSNSSTETSHKGQTPEATHKKGSAVTHKAGNIPSLFAARFTADRIETLFSPAAYQRISKRLFPSLVAHKRTDGSQLPTVATGSLRQPTPPQKPSKAGNRKITTCNPEAPGDYGQLPAVFQVPRFHRQAAPVTEPSSRSPTSGGTYITRPIGQKSMTRVSFAPKGPVFHSAYCPAVGDVSDTPPFLLPLISQLHGYLRHGINNSIPH